MFIFHSESYKAPIPHKREVSSQLKAREPRKLTGLWSLNFSLQKCITPFKGPLPSHTVIKNSSSWRGDLFYTNGSTAIDYCSDLRISLFKLEVTGSMQIHIFFFLFNMCKTRQKFQILICFFLSIFFPFFPLTFIYNLLPQVHFLVQINTKIWSEINIFFLVCLFSFL